MRKCLYFFLGLLTSLLLAVLADFNTGDQKEQRVKAVLGEETAQTTGLASKTKVKPAAELAPGKKVP